MPNTSNDTPESPDHGYDRPSKAQVKREMLALLDLGKQLVDLSSDQLKQLPLSEKLYDAVRLAQRTTSREGLRRQIHFVGKLIRDADADAIRTQLDIWENGERTSVVKGKSVSVRVYLGGHRINNKKKT